ncbi:MAG TPA: hypothetical protein VFS40_13705 [Gemmatimonadales bacterium]|nr:hypothetical protein [Gemmatimonadales bacterium]
MQGTMKRLTTALMVAALGAAPLRAQAPASTAAPAPASPLAITAENRTAAADAAKGTKRTDDAVRNGDVVRYRLAFTNTAGRTIRNVVLSDPIPAGLHYVAGSARTARADARLEFSADGGKSWAATPMEKVVVNGKTVTRPVPAERYTDVRWRVPGLVEPGTIVTAEFDARMEVAAPAQGAETQQQHQH